MDKKTFRSRRIAQAMVIGCVLATSALVAVRAQSSQCDTKPGVKNACSMASNLAENMRKVLPMKVSDQVSLESASAERNVVAVTGKFQFDREVAAAFFAKNKLTLEEFQNIYSERVKPNLCRLNSETREFIESGGVVEYRYLFSDNTPFMKFGVSKC